MCTSVCLFSSLLGRPGVPQLCLQKCGAPQQSSELTGSPEQQGSEPP